MNHKAFLFKLKSLSHGDSFLNILIEFLNDQCKRVLVDGSLVLLELSDQEFYRLVYLDHCYLSFLPVMIGTEFHLK